MFIMTIIFTHTDKADYGITFVHNYPPVSKLHEHNNITYYIITFMLYISIIEVILMTYPRN